MPRATRRHRAPQGVATTGELIREITNHAGAGPTASGGAVDANWQRALDAGEETAGGSVSTPDEDVVDVFARALGVERASDAPVTTSQEMLGERDRQRWRQEQPATQRAQDAERARNEAANKNEE